MSRATIKGLCFWGSSLSHEKSSGHRELFRRTTVPVSPDLDAEITMIDTKIRVYNCALPVPRARNVLCRFFHATGVHNYHLCQKFAVTSTWLESMDNSPLIFTPSTTRWSCKKISSTDFLLQNLKAKTRLDAQLQFRSLNEFKMNTDLYTHSASLRFAKKNRLWW